jgi:hypothetical protein
MKALLALALAACAASPTANPDLADSSDMLTVIPSPDLSGCNICSAFVTNCGTGLNCSKVLDHTGSLCCKTPGNKTAGTPCNTDEDCAADTVCLPDKTATVQFRCYALCDGSHPCAGAAACNVFGGLQVCR